MLSETKQVSKFPRCDLHYGMIEGGHRDAGGEEAHAGAGHHVDLVGPDVVIQRRVLRHFSISSRYFG